MGAKPSAHSNGELTAETGKQELFIAITGPLGTDLHGVAGLVEKSLRRMSYESTHIRLSKLLRNMSTGVTLAEKPFDDYVRSHMDAGDKARAKMSRGDALAIASILSIRDERKKLNGGGEGAESKGVPHRSYILDSLKHPAEVQTLRKIYDQNFFLLAANSPRDARLKRVAGLIAEHRHHLHATEYQSIAGELVARDELDPRNEFGQNVQDAFPLGDFFLDASSSELLSQSIDRCIDLIFGHPFRTPTKDEYGMFHAQAAALRSAALARQVGAAITNDEGEVVSVGTNEVPKAGGGLYWESEHPDERDFKLKKDSNRTIRRVILADALDRLKSEGWLNLDLTKADTDTLVEKALSEGGVLKDSQLIDQVMSDRTVHAEMAAVTDSARRTISTKGCTLYTTTFPCHNCTKNIVATGIKRVVYIEPYPKSLAAELHPDSVSLDGTSDKGQIKFEIFMGVSPRRYIDLFTMPQRRDQEGNPIEWKSETSTMRYYKSSLAYLAEEGALLRSAS